MSQQPLSPLTPLFPFVNLPSILIPILLGIKLVQLRTYGDWVTTPTLVGSNEMTAPVLAEPTKLIVRDMRSVVDPEKS